MTADVSLSRKIASKHSIITYPANRSLRQHQPNVESSPASGTIKTRASLNRQLTYPPRIMLRVRSVLFAICFSIVLCCSAVDATYTKGAQELDVPSELLFDRRDPPKVNGGRHIRHRTRTTTSLTTAILAPTTSTSLDHTEIESPPSPTTSTSSSTTKTVPPLQTAHALSNSSLPQPFDGSLGNNFTAPSCPAFFHHFLDNELFKQCLPLSLLLQTSTSFFDVTHSPVNLTKTLDATCSVDFPRCNALMSNLSVEIQESSNCGQDFTLQNPLVQEAYNGFVAYAPLYYAGCLKGSTAATTTASLVDSNKNNKTNNSKEEGAGGEKGQPSEYCFVVTATNASAPTGIYVYYVPLGIQLPGDTMPSCNACLKATMGIFRSYAADANQSLSQDYAGAAQEIDMFCGPEYVSAAVTSTSGAMRRHALPIGGSTSSSGSIMGCLVAILILRSLLSEWI